MRWRLATADDTPAPSLDEYIASWLERDRLREMLVDWMKDVPLLVAPVGATPAYKHDTLKVTVGDRTMGSFKAFSYAQTFNVFDLPVVVVPAGKTTEGLPIGVQVIGRPFAEETVLAAAAIIEEALGRLAVAGSGAVARPSGRAPVVCCPRPPSRSGYCPGTEDCADNLRSDIVSTNSSN